MTRYTFQEIHVNTLNQKEREDIVSLFQQLSSRKSYGDIFLKYNTDGYRVFVMCFVDDTLNGKERHIIAMITLSLIHTMAKTFGQIQDVVTDEAHRGKQYGRTIGIAEEMLQEIIAIAREINLTYLELTSKPSREAANHLYQKVGFTLLSRAENENGTNLYRLYLDANIERKKAYTIGRDLVNSY